MNTFYELYDLANELGFNRLLDSITNENYFPYKVIAKTKEDEVSIEIELPRIKKEDIKVSTKSGNLIVEVKADKTYTKTGKINSKYDTDLLEVKLEYGVLSIVLKEKTDSKASEKLYEIK